MPDLSRSALGTAVQRARQDAGLSQDELGQKTGLGQTVVSRIESAARKIDLVELLRIAAAVDTTVDELLAVATAIDTEPHDLDGAHDEHALLALRLGSESSPNDVKRAMSWVPAFVGELRELEALRDAERDRG